MRTEDTPTAGITHKWAKTMISGCINLEPTPIFIRKSSIVGALCDLPCLTLRTSSREWTNSLITLAKLHCAILRFGHDWALMFGPIPTARLVDGMLIT